MLPSDHRLVATLERRAASAIAQVLDNGGARTKRPTGEVSAVQTMTLDGFQGVAHNWTPPLRRRRYRIDLKSVFVHSSPQVVWQNPGESPRRCELADLLVVIDHKGPDNVADRRAVLIQAKLLKGGMIRPRGREWVQFELLSEWPTFTFRTPGFAPRPRDFLHAALPYPANSGEYGGIDLLAARRTWIQEMASRPRQFIGTISLATLLARMAFGKSKHGREAIANGSDDWSFTVDELLRLTSQFAITKLSSALRSSAYSAGFIAMASSGIVMASGGGASGGAVPPIEDGDFRPEGPISTVHITLTHEDYREAEG